MDRRSSQISESESPGRRVSSDDVAETGGFGLSLREHQSFLVSMEDCMGQAGGFGQDLINDEAKAERAMYP